MPSDAVCALNESSSVDVRPLETTCRRNGTPPPTSSSPWLHTPVRASYHVPENYQLGGKSLNILTSRANDTEEKQKKTNWR